MNVPQSNATARRTLVAGLLLGLVMEAVTAVARFGFGLRSTQDTGFLAGLTFGLRIHHGYVGALLLLAAPFIRVAAVRRGLVVLGVGLVSSDLMHHFAVLWPITGSPHWDWVYPPPGEGPPPAGVLQQPSAGWALWLAEWVVRLGMLAVVPVRRPPASATAWLLLIFLFPWPGLVLYLLIGTPQMPRWRRRQLAEFDRETAPLRARADEVAGDTRVKVRGPMAGIARLSGQLGRFHPVGGNRVELLTDTDGVMARIAADLDRAEHHAHLLYYIAAADGATEPVMAALVRAVGRGVQCRLVYDWQGSRRFAAGLHARLDGTGVAVRAALPLRLLSRHATRADLRNHRKLTVIDGRAGYVGSHNLCSRGFIPGLEYEDLSARVNGPAVAQLQLVFATDWWLEAGELLADPVYFPTPVRAGEAVGQVLPSGPEYPIQNFQRVLVDLVHLARRRVTVVTPYLVPDDPLLQAFETATHRGVRVRVVVAATVDQPFVRLCQESYYAQMLGSGVEVYRYRGRFLHSKLGVADGRVCTVGSCNADIRSFQLNAEVNLLLYDPRSVRAAARQAAVYIAESDRLTAAEWAARPGWRRPVENLARLWSPLL